MYINGLLKRQLSLSAVTLFLIVFVIFGLSYAVFEKTVEDTETQSMSVGDLNIAFSNSAAINLNDFEPMTDTDAMSNENNNYSFVINNNGSVAYEYIISLLNNPTYLSGGANYNSSRVLLDHNYVRANLSGTESDINNEELGNISFVNQTFALGEKTNGVIYRFVVNPQKSHQFNLKVWIADAETYLLPNEAIGAEVHLNIKIEGWATGEIYAFNYTGSQQTFTAPKSGTYKIELWGAQGGHDSGSGCYGGKGGYSSGKIYLKKDDILYLMIGGQPSNINGGYNGGGSGAYDNSATNARGGGGATDIRYFENIDLAEDDLLWNSELGLKSRIMVAGGGGGWGWSSDNVCHNGSAAGGIVGYQDYYGDTSFPGGGQGTQISAGQASGYSSTLGSFGRGGSGYSYQGDSVQHTSGGGGSGWYGGGGGASGANKGYNGIGGGGSSYISGHTGCVAITSSTSTTPRTGTDGASCDTGTSDNLCSVHYSGKTFTNTVMIDGAGYEWTHEKGGLKAMPNPNGGYYADGVGHTGDGFAKITFIG